MDLILHSGTLRRERQDDAFLRLDAKDECVGLRLDEVAQVPFTFDGREQVERGTLELDGDLRQPGGQAFTGAQIERDSGPAPIVDADLHRHVRLPTRVGGNASSST